MDDNILIVDDTDEPIKQSCKERTKKCLTIAGLIMVGLLLLILGGAMATTLIKGVIDMWKE
jgi:hypothetical protein